MKIGDIITQNKYFYECWESPKYYRNVINVIDNIIYFNCDIKVRSKTTRKIHYYDSLHESYLKIDIQKTRKQKLEKLNNV